MNTRYHYRARNKQGEVLTGFVEAESMEAAQRILTDNALSVLSLETPKSLLEYFGLRRKISVKQKAFYTRQLATMINAGLPLTQVLSLLSRSEKNVLLKKVTIAVQEDLEAGYSFSTSIAKHPEVFSRVFVNAVRSGEATGKLEVVLEQLADTLERDSKSSARFKSLMIYPIFVIGAMIVVGGIMMVKVVPVLTGIFAAANTQLPLLTRILITTSEILRQWWVFFIIIALLLFFFIRAWFETDRGRWQWDRFKLVIPYFKGVSQSFYMARFGRTLGMLVTAGVPLLEAIQITSEAMDNVVYKDQLEKASYQVERGVPLSAAISRTPLFPPLIVQMIMTGEQTGELDKILTRVSTTYENEYDSAVKGSTTLIEPIIVVILGLGVTFLVFAIIIPIYQVSAIT